QHLQVLQAARLVETEKDGLNVTYRLADERVALFFRELRGLAQARLTEIEHVTRTFLDDEAALEPIDRETLVKRVRAGDVTLLDVRPAEEYRAGHIPGAISVPIDELKGRLAKLPKSRTIVAYCRGPYCVFAMD